MIRRRAREHWRHEGDCSASGSQPGGERPASAADDDARLLLAAREGDVGAFNRLVDLHTPVIFNVCLRLLRDDASAEDATQETFIRAWRAIETWHGGMVRPWLIRIATNRCYDVLRSQARRPVTSLDAEPFETEPQWSSQAQSPEDPERFAMRSDLSAYLERALSTLPEDQRLAIILADIHGLGYEEVAEATGVAVGTVKSRISRGRGRLRDALRDDAKSAELFGHFRRLLDDN
ncbi:MAG TPA: sigma-70 family RNA polymerase sigma factor [Thermomicrobiales bacterium]|nr:sigma-70 family RNA polymerase sigma factor [Thermomicrobiales bacterium]